MTYNMSLYPRLFSPFGVGSVMLKNRVVYPAHLTNLAENGMITDKLISYYEERARGGVGLIITEEQSVHPTDHAYEKMIHAFRPEVLKGYQQLTERIHRYGTAIFAQINHNGGQSSSMYNDLPVWAPSSLADPMFREIAHALEEEEIDAIVEGYSFVAHQVQQGGFDGAELQGSHSALIRQFLSPATNLRQDSYGGELPARMRFLWRVIEAVRSSTGRDFVLGVRLCGDELIEGGLTLPEVVEVARQLSASGLVDYLDTSIGTATQSLYLVEGSMHVAPGYSLFVSSDIRREVSIPVIGVGRIKDPAQAEEALAEGHCDLIGMVRAQIADPFWVDKARTNRTDEICLCLSCNQECIGRMGLNRTLSCIENPAVGNERKMGILAHIASNRRRRVMIVGAGPAGLKAAAVCAARGYTVTVYEQSMRPGGQVNYAVMMPNRSEFGDIVRNLELELSRLKVPVIYETSVDAKQVVGENPDAVVIATGCREAPTQWAAGNPRVMGMRFLLDHIQEEWVQTSLRIAVVDGLGTHEATSLTEWLAVQGKQVTLFSSSLFAGQLLSVTLDWELWYRRLRHLAVELVPDVTPLKCEGQNLRLVHNYSGKDINAGPFDLVIDVQHGVANDTLYRELKGQVRQLFRIGDAVAPRLASHAIMEAETVGRAIS